MAITFYLIGTVATSSFRKVRGRDTSLRCDSSSPNRSFARRTRAERQRTHSGVMHRHAAAAAASASSRGCHHLPLLGQHGHSHRAQSPVGVERVHHVRDEQRAARTRVIHLAQQRCRVRAQEAPLRRVSLLPTQRGGKASVRTWMAASKWGATALSPQGVPRAVGAQSPRTVTWTIARGHRAGEALAHACFPHSDSRTYCAPRSNSSTCSGLSMPRPLRPTTRRPSLAKLSKSTSGTGRTS